MTVFTPSEASRTLPLVRTIVADILETGKIIRRMQFDFGALVGDIPEYQSHVATLKGYIAELESLGCIYKDYDFSLGLVDFPAIIDGEECFLCWRSDEPLLMYYHSIKGGYAGRKLIPEELLNYDEAHYQHTVFVS
ncbi:MAG: DUF2203 domain-containing protein [Candidatus Kapabacteria bacterium]|nr:DUF2203 domain-containing protein [Candidatus Kapabacteria bacterium]